jgi:hypothetical protein
MPNPKYIVNEQAIKATAVITAVILSFVFSGILCIYIKLKKLNIFISLAFICHIYNMTDMPGKVPVNDDKIRSENQFIRPTVCRT